MNRVLGRVLVQETSVGIPDLVVAVLDIDLPQTPPKKKRTNRPPSASQQEGAALDRLGSVLTDAAGRFELEFKDAAFQIGDQEKRPDLQLVVYAPEDVADLKNRTPLPPEKRILVHSDISRADAGRTESYVLRIPAALLEKYGVPVPGKDRPRDPDADARALVEAHAYSERLGDKIRDGLKEHRELRLQRRKEQRGEGLVFATKLMFTTPLALRAQPNFLSIQHIDDQDRFDEAYHHTMESGIEIIGRVNANVPLVVDFLDEQLEPGEGHRIAESVSGIEIDHERLCELMLRRRGGVAHERVRDLIEAWREDRRNADRLDRITGDGNGEIAEPTTGDGSEPAPLYGMDLVAAAVEQEVAEYERMTNDDQREASGWARSSHEPATSVEELGRRVAGIQYPVGPTDVPSYHDFQHLQIAFRHIWTEAFDEQLRGDISDLYKEYVEVHEDYLRGSPFSTPEEFQEIRDLNDFLRTVGRNIDELAEEPPEEVRNSFAVSRGEWSQLSDPQKSDLRQIAEAMSDIEESIAYHRLLELEAPELVARRNDYFRRGRDIIANPAGGVVRLKRLLEEVASRLGEEYSFRYYAPNSINFGILTTYRQRWVPLRYQVGDLVATVPLAPGEVRKFSSKTVVKTSRSQKEVEKALSSRSGESSTTGRAEAEISGKASSSTNFKLTTQGSFSFPIGSASTSTEFGTNQASESAKAKKDYREATSKAAQEYKQERAVEVSTTDEISTEVSSSGELRNANNETTVTYVLYELERQYEISERLQKVTPVILVAQDVPAPNEITEAWLLEHAWILRRVLLDDGFEQALTELEDGFAGEEIGVAVKRANWETQRRLVEKLEARAAALISVRDELRGSLGVSEEAFRDSSVRDRALLYLFLGIERELPFDPEEPRREEDLLSRKQLKERIEGLKRELESVGDWLAEAQNRLAAAQQALQTATQEYTDALEAQTNRKLLIDQLRLHVKANILHYMQAIWDHEPTDQRFFRLQDVEVHLPQTPTRRCRLRLATEEEVRRGTGLLDRGGTYYVIERCDPPRLPDFDSADRRRLIEIADLDKPLGYKGNYIIFPLKTCVYLTEYMMKQFIDTYLGVRDPDQAGEVTTTELLDFLEEVWHDEERPLSDEEREALLDMVHARLRDPRRDSELIIVPTGQLYIDALVGTHSLLERFKLAHRIYDVGKVRAELLRDNLENLRRAARLLSEEPDLDDPEVDKTVRVDGAAGVTVEG